MFIENGIRLNNDPSGVACYHTGIVLVYILFDFKRLRVASNALIKILFVFDPAGVVFMIATVFL